MNTGGDKSLFLRVAMLTVTVPTMTLANSLFVVSNHGSGVTEVYEIDGYQLNLTLSCSEFANYGLTFALSPDDEVLFCSFDQANRLEAAHARSMKKVKTFNSPGEAAGLAFDPATRRLFAARRETEYLDIYEWDSAMQELTCAQSVNLSAVGPYGVFDLSLDVQEQVLHVSDKTSLVYRYDVSGQNPDYVDSIELDDGTNTYDAVGMDFYDGGPGSRFLYAGAWVHQQGHPYLVRVDLDRYAADPDDPNAIIAKDIGTMVVGVAVDPDTGLVYVTTHRTVDYHTGAIEVYDTSGWTDDPNQAVTYTDIISGGNINHPAGLIVGPTYKPSLMTVTKTDNVDPCDCVDPNDTFTYTICYAGDPNEAQTNTTLIDYLPYGVTFESADPCNVGDYYDEDAHAFVWDLGTVAPYDPNDPCDGLTLTVRANDWAEPLRDLVNEVVLESDGSYTQAFHTTSVCETGAQVLFVDADATYETVSFGGCTWEIGKNTGNSWEDAYRTLDDALLRARDGGPQEIWVAQGVYKPRGGDSTATFDLPENLAVYGGFAGYEGIRTDRNWRVYTTVLDGEVCYQPVDHVVTLGAACGGARLDGFTITGGEVGIYCEDTLDGENYYPTVAHCRIEDNPGDGLMGADTGDVLVADCHIEGNDGNGVTVDSGSYVQIQDTAVRNNSAAGIAADGAWVEMTASVVAANAEQGIRGYQAGLFLTNSSITSSGDDGVYSDACYLEMQGCLVEGNDGAGLALSGPADSLVARSRIRANRGPGIACGSGVLDTEVRNCWVHHNSGAGFAFDGATLEANVRNNTIVANGGPGVQRLDGRRPAVTNCILWANAASGNQVQLSDCTATYSCIQDPCGPSGLGNINSDPCFAYPAIIPNDFHLDPCSLCRNQGDPNVLTAEETDIDGEARLADGDVEMGADEIHACANGIANRADWNADGTVHLREMGDLADAWLSTSTDPNTYWNALCDLDADDTVDVSDLVLFAPEWLWRACWHEAAYDSGQVLLLRSEGQSEATLRAALGLPGQPRPETAAVALALPGPSIDQQMATVAECIIWCKRIWEETPELRRSGDVTEWRDFMNRLWQMYYTLAAGR